MLKKSMLDLHRVSAEEFKTVEKIPVAVLLDDVRSEMNVGSVLRTADAFVINQVVLCGITGQPPSHEIHKTALGAEDSVTWSYSKSALDAVEQLREQGYKICSIEQVHGSVSLERFHIEPGEKYALVFGNEVYLWQRGERREPGGGRCQRLLHRDSAARHQALAQHRLLGSHRDVALLHSPVTARGRVMSSGARAMR